MTDTLAATGNAQRGHALRRFGLAMCVVSAALALRSWVQLAHFGGTLSRPWYGQVALTFSLLAAGGALSWGLSVLLRTRSPGLSDVAAIVGIICGLLPPTLTLAFVLLETFG